MEQEWFASALATTLMATTREKRRRKFLHKHTVFICTTRIEGCRCFRFASGVCPEQDTDIRLSDNLICADFKQRGEVCQFGYAQGELLLRTLARWRTPRILRDDR